MPKSNDLGARDRMLQVSRLLMRYFVITRRCACFRETEISGYGLRPDFTAIDSGFQITFVETKSCIQGFKTDWKWQKYLQFCNFFYFCTDDWKTLQYMLSTPRISTQIGILFCNREGLLVKSYRRVQKIHDINTYNRDRVLWGCLKRATPMIQQNGFYVNTSCGFLPKNYQEFEEFLIRPADEFIETRKDELCRWLKT